MLFRLSVAGTATDGGPLAAPGFGTQLQLRAIQGFQPEAQIAVTYAESTGRFGDGISYSCRSRPILYRIPTPPCPVVC